MSSELFKTRQSVYQNAQNWWKMCSIALFLLILATVVVARKYPESSFAGMLRIMLFDETLLQDTKAQAALENTYAVVSAHTQAIFGNKEKLRIQEGYHPAQKQNKKLDSLYYVGLNYFASAEPITGYDLDSNCIERSLSTYQVDRLVCNEAVKMNFKDATQTCKERFGGILPTKELFMEVTIRSKKILKSKSEVWLNEVKVKKGFFLDTYFARTFNAFSGESFKVEQDETRAFYCFAKIKPQAKQ